MKLPKVDSKTLLTYQKCRKNYGRVIFNNKKTAFTGLDPENSVDDYLGDVTANLILIIGQDSVKHNFNKTVFIDAQH